MPCREVTAFLFVYNLAQWLVVTFEMQKLKSSVEEAEFYGSLVWVIIQRIALPLLIFFRYDELIGIVYHAMSIEII
jgi:hypothetical protein